MTDTVPKSDVLVFTNHTLASLRMHGGFKVTREHCGDHPQIKCLDWLALFIISKVHSVSDESVIGKKSDGLGSSTTCSSPGARELWQSSKSRQKSVASALCQRQSSFDS